MILLNNRTIHLIILLFFLSMTPLSGHPDSKGVNHKEWTKEQSLIRWLSECVSWISCTCRTILYFSYFIIKTVVHVLMCVMTGVFSILHQSIKFIKYCVRVVLYVLEANYDLISFCLKKIRPLLENSYVLLKWLVEFTVKTLIFLVQTLFYILRTLSLNALKLVTLAIELLYNVLLSCGKLLYFIGERTISLVIKLFKGLVFIIPKLFKLTVFGVEATLKIAGSFIQKTRSTFHTLFFVVKPVAEQFGRFLFNTLKLAVDLLYSVLLSLGYFIYFVGENIVNLAVKLFRSLVFIIPKLFKQTAIGVETTVKMAGSLIHKVISALHSFVSTIKPIVELFVRFILNTFELTMDLLYNGLLSCGQFLQFAVKYIISLAIKLCKSVIFLFEKIWTEIGTNGPIIINYAKLSFQAGLQFVKAVFLTFYDIILSVLQAIGLFVTYCGTFMSNTFTALWTIVNSAVKSITQISYIVSISCTTLVAALIWVIFKFDVFILCFGLLESLIQNVTLMWIMANEGKKTDTNRNRQATDVINSSTSVSTSGNEELLRRQLEIERDKSLCVVCQDHVKNVVLLPCRHLCTCETCANYLTSLVDWNTRLCPICREPIESTLKVYS